MTINYAHRWNINGKVHYLTSVDGKSGIVREDGKTIFVGTCAECFEYANRIIRTSHYGGTILSGRERIS